MSLAQAASRTARIATDPVDRRSAQAETLVRIGITIEVAAGQTIVLEGDPCSHCFRVLTGGIDIANARIEFASGCVASVSASRVSQVPVRKLRVIRGRSYVSADLQGQRLRTVRRTRSGIREVERAFERTDALALQAAAFVRAVRSRRSPAVGGDEGRRALQLALEVSRLVGARLAKISARRR